MSPLLRGPWGSPAPRILVRSGCPSRLRSAAPLRRGPRPRAPFGEAPARGPPSARLPLVGAPRMRLSPSGLREVPRSVLGEAPLERPREAPAQRPLFGTPPARSLGSRPRQGPTGRHTPYRSPRGPSGHPPQAGRFSAPHSARRWRSSRPPQAPGSGRRQRSRLPPRVTAGGRPRTRTTAETGRCPRWGSPSSKPSRGVPAHFRLDRVGLVPPGGGHRVTAQRSSSEQARSGRGSSRTADPPAGCTALPTRGPGSRSIADPWTGRAGGSEREPETGRRRPTRDGSRRRRRVSPPSAGSTAAGLPKRVPKANLVPGIAAGRRAGPPRCRRFRRTGSQPPVEFPARRTAGPC